MYIWHRLPEDVKPDLLTAYESDDYVKVLTIINRHRIAPGILTICCDIGPAWEAIAEALRTETLKP